MSRKPTPLFRDPVKRHVAGLRGLLGMLEAAQVPCRRATGYEHRYCCEVHANPGAHHGDFPPEQTRCRAWPTLAPVAATLPELP